MANLTSRKVLKKRLLEAIGNASPVELGKLAVDMMSDIDAVYDEAGVVEGDGETFEYSFAGDRINREIERQLADLKDEYARRFSGVKKEDVPPGNIRDISEDQKQKEHEETIIVPDEKVEETVTYDDIFEEREG